MLKKVFNFMSAALHTPPALLLALLLALSPARAAAQAPPGDDPDAQHGEDEDLIIVVTGARTQSRLADATVATEVITAQDMERAGAQTLAQALDDHPGVDVTPGLGGSGVRLQGLDPQYVLILVDGQRINGRVEGAIDLQRFSVEDIEQVEIVRGASTALYGADALGGVINIITRRPVSNLDADLSASGGELGSLDLSGGLGWRGDRAHARLSASWHQLDAFDLDPADLTTQGSQQRAWDLALQGGWSLPDALSIDLRADYLRRDLQGVDANAAGATFDRRNLIETSTLALRATAPLSDQLLLSGGASYALYRDQFLYDQRGASAGDQDQQTLDHAAQANLQADLTLEQHLLTLGLEAILERIETPRLQSGASDRGRAALIAQDQWRPLPALAVVPGARLDLDSRFGPVASPSLALRWDPLADLTLRASGGRGFRAPSFKEQFLLFENPGANYLVQGNPGLRPERAWSVNLGASWQPSPWASLDLSLFRNDIQDLIAVQTLDPGDATTATRFSYANLASAWTRGLESNLRLKPWRGASADLGYVLTDTRDEAADRPLEGRALHRLGVGLTQRHQPSGLEATLRGALNGARPFYQDTDGDGLDETRRADPYLTLDARLAWELWPELSLFGGAENILNAGDAELLPLRPRRLYAGLSARY
jgi:outer membrane receptor for ferrienterochelin and colicins